MKTASHQAGTQTPVIFNTIVSSDRWGSEPTAESAKDELQAPLANGSGGHYPRTERTKDRKGVNDMFIL